MTLRVLWAILALLYGGFLYWYCGRVAVVRYRSRRDFLEIVSTSDWAQDAVHKWAAIERTQSFPTEPALSPPGPRSIVLVLLVLIGTGVHRLLRRRATAPGAAG